MTAWYDFKPQIDGYEEYGLEPSVKELLQMYYAPHIPHERIPALIEEYVQKSDYGFGFYQKAIEEWAMKCFGENTDKAQRVFRFLEEANELAQSLGCTKEQAHELVEYTWGREIGDPIQEVGGVMVTLTMLCNYHGLNLQGGAFGELNRINQPEVIEKIRAKNKTKPRFSPLPGVADA